MYFVALEKLYHKACLNQSFKLSQNRPKLIKKTMDYRWVKILRMDHFKNFKLNVLSDRVFSGLSENYKIIQTEPSELKL